jgi:hypothetical protein
MQELLPDDPKIKEEPGIKKEEDLKPQLSVDKQDPYEEGKTSRFSGSITTSLSITEDAAQLLVQSYSVKKEEPTEYELPHIHVKKEDLGTSSMYPHRQRSCTTDTLSSQRISAVC